MEILKDTLFELYYCINTCCVLHFTVEQMNHLDMLFIGCIFTRSSDGSPEATHTHTDRPGATDLPSYWMCYVQERIT